jgi:hypothetical protein
LKPISSPHTTRILGAPSNWDESKGECQSLPISDSKGVMYSYWRLSFKERVLILFGRPIRLAVVGTSHPPVWVDTDR